MASCVDNEELSELLNHVRVNDVPSLEKYLKRFDESRLRQLMGEGDPLNVSALMYASHWGHKEVATILIDAGSDVDKKDAKGHTALMYASSNCCFELMEILLKSGANPNIMAKGGYNALICSCQRAYMLR